MMTVVLSHIGNNARIDEVDGVSVVPVPGEGPVPDDVQGDVLLTLAWGSANLADVIERGVRWVHTLGTGVDRFPLHLVGDRILSCSRGASAIPIAEWVLAMMLAFEKQLPSSWITEPPERWNVARLGGLADKTLGLVGLGGIAVAVAQRALPFDMRVMAVRRTAAPSPLPGVEVVTSLADVLAAADHLVIAAPATADTRHLLDAEALAAVKPGVHIVNIARGSLIDQDALREALDSDRVAMASLDTVDPEPLPEGHWMYSHPKVRLSPHISWSDPDALDRLMDTFIDNLRRWQKGEPLDGVVDVAAGY